MSTLHLDNLHIKHFKCFDSFELTDIQRVNLIGGKNNVGKTSLLEAIEIVVSASTARALISKIDKMLYRRQVTGNRGAIIEIDFLHSEGNATELLTSSRRCRISLVGKNSKLKQQSLFGKPHDFYEYEDDEDISMSKLLFSVDSDEEIVPASYFLRRKPGYVIRASKRDNRNSPSVNYIESKKLDDNDIAILYGSLIDLNREAFIDESLSLFDENILSIKQRAIDDGIIVLKLLLKNQTSPVLLSSLGEGVNRYIAILCAIWASKDGVLLIDEIENGIHYSNYKKIWKLIHQASADANCQLFITSHSKECIEAFSETLSEPENIASGIYYEMYKNIKKETISVSARDRGQLHYTLTHNGNFRGE